MLEEHNEIIYLCEHCDDMFKDKAEMQEHDKTVHGGIKYPCPEFDCPYTTSDVKELEEHVEIHQEFEIPCEFCEYKAQAMRKLNDHMDECHDGITFYCGHCEFKATEREDLNVHLEIHKQNVASCSRCDFTTANAKLLKIMKKGFTKLASRNVTIC